MRGSITKRGDSWSALVDLPPDPVTGKRRRKRITARTKREVETQVAELIHKAETGFTAAGKLTVREFFERWLESAAPTLRPSTARRYRDVARLHIVGVIGNVRAGQAHARRRAAALCQPAGRWSLAHLGEPHPRDPASGAGPGGALGAPDAQRHRHGRCAAALLAGDARVGCAPGGRRAGCGCG